MDEETDAVEKGIVEGSALLETERAKSESGKVNSLERETNEISEGELVEGEKDGSEKENSRTDRVGEEEEEVAGAIPSDARVAGAQFLSIEVPAVAIDALKKCEKAVPDGDVDSNAKSEVLVEDRETKSISPRETRLYEQQASTSSLISRSSPNSSAADEISLHLADSTYQVACVNEEEEVEEEEEDSREQMLKSDSFRRRSEEQVSTYDSTSPASPLIQPSDEELPYSDDSPRAPEATLDHEEQEHVLKGEIPEKGGDEAAVDGEKDEKEVKVHNADVGQVFEGEIAEFKEEEKDAEERVDDADVRQVSDGEIVADEREEKEAKDREAEVSEGEISEEGEEREAGDGKTEEKKVDDEARGLRNIECGEQDAAVGRSIVEEVTVTVGHSEEVCDEGARKPSDEKTDDVNINGIKSIGGETEIMSSEGQVEGDEEDPYSSLAAKLSANHRLFFYEFDENPLRASMEQFQLPIIVEEEDEEGEVVGEDAKVRAAKDDSLAEDETSGNDETERNDGFVPITGGDDALANDVLENSGAKGEDAADAGTSCSAKSDIIPLERKEANENLNATHGLDEKAVSATVDDAAGAAVDADDAQNEGDEEASRSALLSPSSEEHSFLFFVTESIMEIDAENHKNADSPDDGSKEEVKGDDAGASASTAPSKPFRAESLRSTTTSIAAKRVAFNQVSNAKSDGVVEKRLPSRKTTTTTPRKILPTPPKKALMTASNSPSTVSSTSSPRGRRLTPAKSEPLKSSFKAPQRPTLGKTYQQQQQQQKKSSSPQQMVKDAIGGSGDRPIEDESSDVSVEGEKEKGEVQKNVPTLESIGDKGDGGIEEAKAELVEDMSTNALDDDLQDDLKTKIESESVLRLLDKERKDIELRLHSSKSTIRARKGLTDDLDEDLQMPRIPAVFYEPKDTSKMTDRELRRERILRQHLKEKFFPSPPEHVLEKMLRQKEGATAAAKKSKPRDRPWAQTPFDRPFEDTIG